LAADVAFLRAMKRFFYFYRGGFFEEKIVSYSSPCSTVGGCYGKFPNVKHHDAAKFVEWVTSEEGKRLSGILVRINTVRLFFPNSEVGKI
jgi:hypothetical protein